MRLSIPMTILAVATLAAAGCASMRDEGWRGDGAEPFDDARAACEADAAAKPEGGARTDALEACMAGKGWHRP
jgi:hypothetical protein